jgi:hypothetical protein
MRHGIAVAGEGEWKEVHMKTAVLGFEAYKDMKNAKRAVRKGWRAVEGFAAEARSYIKKEPLKSVGFVFGIAFGVAFGMGTATGWLISRR